MNRIPIRLRFALLAASAVAAGALLIGVVAVLRSEAATRQDFDHELIEETAEAAIAVQSGLTLDTFRHPQPAHGVLLLTLFDQEGRVIEGASAVAVPPMIASDPGTFYEFEDSITGEGYRAYSRPVPGEGRTGILVGSLSAASLIDESHSLRLEVGATIVLVTVLAGLGVFFLTGRVLLPVERLRRSAEELAADPGGRRLDVPPARDEVRRLAQSFNAGLERIDEMMATQRRFLAEASHELRTPITRLRAEIDLAQRPQRTHEELVAAVAGFDEHADHLTSLADNFLATLTPEKTPAKSAVPISVNQILANLRNLDAHGELIQIDVPRDIGKASVIAEPAALVGVLSNMVGNAFRHGAPPVELSVRRIENGLAFTVCDCGPGISAEAREQVLQPYTQGPAATSGTGLGLFIVHSFAASRGGELLIEDADPGCRMVLRLPFEFVTV